MLCDMRLGKQGTYVYMFVDSVDESDLAWNKMEHFLRDIDKFAYALG